MGWGMGVHSVHSILKLFTVSLAKWSLFLCIFLRTFYLKRKLHKYSIVFKVHFTGFFKERLLVIFFFKFLA